MKPSNNLEKKTPADTYSLVCKKVQAHSFLEPPLEYNQDQMPLTNEGLEILVTITFQCMNYVFLLIKV